MKTIDRREISNEAVIVACSGGLGNLMFQIAAGATLAKKNNMGLCLFFKERFGINFERQKKYGNFLKGYDVVDPSEGGAFYIPEEDPSINLLELNLPHGAPLPFMIDGYWGNPKYFDDELAHALFDPSKEYLDKINDAYGDLSDYVSINVRRGDYVGLGLSRGGDYYMNIYNKHFKGKKAIVIGEDVEWNKENIPIEGAIYICNNEDPLMDIYTGAQCKDHIICDSTFAWWTAWLGQKEGGITVYPAAWCGNYSHDMGLNGWIRE